MSKLNSVLKTILAAVAVLYLVVVVLVAAPVIVFLDNWDTSLDFNNGTTSFETVCDTSNGVGMFYHFSSRAGLRMTDDEYVKYCEEK